MRSVSISGRAGFIGSHVTNFYLGSDVQKPVVVNNLSTGSFENIAHIKPPPLPPSDMLLDQQSGPAWPLIPERSIGNDTLK